MRSVSRLPLVVAGVVAALALTACGGTSDAELAAARSAGAQEQAQKEEAKRQQDAQASLAAEVERLKKEAEDAKAAEAAKAAAEAKAKAAADAKAKADAAAKAKAAKAKASAQAAQTRCSDRVSAGANTSCAFALTVESAFYNWGGGNRALEVYSPVTGLWYTMHCQAGVPTVCRGGNNAVVYIR
jgi:hypothetical protein